MKHRILLGILCALCALGIASAQSTTGNSVAKVIGQTATISWTAPTTYTTGAPIASGTAITYSVSAALSVIMARLTGWHTPGVGTAARSDWHIPASGSG